MTCGYYAHGDVECEQFLEHVFSFLDGRVTPSEAWAAGCAVKYAWRAGLKERADWESDARKCADFLVKLTTGGFM